MASLTRRFALAASALSLLVLVMSAVASAAITVTNTNDTGAGSLRAAITSANSSPTVATTINFSVSGTITLGSALPAIANSSPNGSLTIDGSGQSITVDGASTFQILTVNSGATLTVENLTMSDGSATLGGGIENEGTLTVSNCTFSGDIGTDGGDGGAIYNTGVLTVTNSTFSGNSAGSGGALDNHATLTITSSTFSGNSAPMGAGGAIRNVGSLKLTNSTFSGNSADVAGLGGAIDNANGASMTIANSTFSGNSVSGEDQFGHTGHGGVIENFGSATLSGVILAASTGGGNCDNVFPGSKLPTSAGFNISDDSSCGFSGTSINSSTTLNLDPRGLQNNGGPTQTIALEAGSDAIDLIPSTACVDANGLPLTLDQRSLPRPG